jgi:hypothetical protein
MGHGNEFNRGAALRSVNRREFVCGLCGSALATTISGMLPQRAWARASDQRKVVVVTFGGGARDEETFAPQGQENIPRLLHDPIDISAG